MNANGSLLRPLNLTRSGQRTRLQRVTGSTGVQSHLASLGFIPGTELEIIRRDAGGPVIVAVRDGRMALGNGLACHLWVE